MANHATPGHLPQDLGPSELISCFYSELRRIAAHYFKKERSDHTLQPTALVHEMFVRWTKYPPGDFANRAHFFGLASRTMRQVLVDYSRYHGAQMRGGGRQRIDLDDVEIPVPQVPDYEEIDRALRALEIQNPRLAQIVELRVFAGLSSDEMGEILGMAESTVRQQWKVAKIWIEKKVREGI